MIVPGTNFANEWWQSLDRRNAPQVPEQPNDYDDIVTCDPGYKPVAAWTEAHTSWPSKDVMYTVNADIVDEKVSVALRSRQGYARGYAYIDVFALCVSS